VVSARLSTASFGATPGFQPKILPSSVEKMKSGAAVVVPFDTLKLWVAFATRPVGLPGTLTGGRAVVPSAR
jgi:hypothetical protein